MSEGLSVFNDSVVQEMIKNNKDACLGLILEQWKTSVDFAKDVSNRRQSVNGLLMTGLSVLLSGILFNNKMSDINYLQSCIIVLMICAAGIILCFLWIKQLEYYSQLIETKYIAIRKLEEKLPARVYTYENENFYTTHTKDKSFSKSEKRIPMVFGTVFLFILVIVGIPFLKSAASMFH